MRGNYDRREYISVSNKDEVVLLKQRCWYGNNEYTVLLQLYRCESMVRCSGEQDKEYL
jgi:hypothetical protein